MTSSRRIHRTTDSLPDSAWETMVAGFRANENYYKISLKLRAMGFAMSERTVARRGYEWRRGTLFPGKTLSRNGAGWIDLLAEFSAIVDVLDLSPEHELHGRQRIDEAVRRFLEWPSMESAQTVQRELARYRLEGLICAGLEKDRAERAVEERKLHNETDAGSDGGQ